MSMEKELHELLMTTDCGNVCCVVCANDRKRIKAFFLQAQKRCIERALLAVGKFTGDKEIVFLVDQELKLQDELELLK